MTGPNRGLDELKAYELPLDLQMMTESVSIRRASVADAHRLSTFARRVFFETFAPHNRAEDVVAYVEQAFGEAIQARELDDPAVIALIAEAGDTLAAYALLRQGDCPESVTGPRPIELVRFYVDRHWQGRGLAQRLMLAVYEAAAADAATLWLGVWEQNVRAIAFYTKCGFRDVGSHVFQLGSDPQTDRIMARSLDFARANGLLSRSSSHLEKDDP